MAAGERGIPGSWAEGVDVDLGRIREIVGMRGPGAMDGYLGAGMLSLLRGVSAERTMSASRWRMLLQCPHQFLFEHVLG